MECCDHQCSKQARTSAYRRVLWIALAVNTAMAGIELVAGLAAGSVSLRADALDFLGDAASYALALLVAGSTVVQAFTGVVPKPGVMGTVAVVALLANLAVAALLYRHREGDSQALSVWLCTRKDCIANLAVLLAGAGVWASSGPWPDIAVAATIAALGLSSAAWVLKRASAELGAVELAA